MALALVELIPTPETHDFETFWLLWAGKKIEKKLCRLQWTHLAGPDQLAAIVGAANWRPHWLREDWRYLPNPLQWIQGERWEDELPRNAQTSIGHVPFAASEPGERSEMPAHVKSLIARLKAQK